MKLKRSFPLLLLCLCLLLTFPAWRSLLYPGFFPSHDGHLHIYWAMQLKKSLNDGHFPVRWGSEFFYGYGLPFFNFYQPLFHYLVALLNILGFSFLSAAKIILISCFILSALFMFLFAFEFWGPWGAAASALAYVYAPFRFVNIYVQGAFPGALTFPLLPLIFWSFYKFFKTKKSIFFFLSSSSLALLPLTHNFNAIATFPFLLGFLWLLYSQKKSAILFFPLFFGLLLGSFYWLPVILEKKYILTEVLGMNYDFRNSFVYLHQLIYSPWGYGGDVIGPNDQLSFMIGFPHLFLVFLSLWAIPRLKSQKAKILIFGFLAFSAATLMTLPISIFIWELIPFFQYAQFPWRFLILVTFFASFISGATLTPFSQKRQQILAIIAIAITLLANISFARPSEIDLSAQDSHFAEQILGVPRELVIGGDFTPRWVLKRPEAPAKSKISPLNPKEGSIFKSHYYQFQVDAPQSTQLTINTFYFPGWKAFIDGQEAKIEIPDTGTMQIKVPQGTHEIKFIFGETFIRKLADLISVFSLIILVVLVVIPGFLSKIETFLVHLFHQFQKSSLWQQIKK